MRCVCDCPTVQRNKGNVLFNDALDTFYLRLYGFGHMVKDNSDSERGNQTAATAVCVHHEDRSNDLPKWN